MVLTIPSKFRRRSSRSVSARARRPGARRPRRPARAPRGGPRTSTCADELGETRTVSIAAADSWPLEGQSKAKTHGFRPVAWYAAAISFVMSRRDDRSIASRAETRRAMRCDNSDSASVSSAAPSPSSGVVVQRTSSPSLTCNDGSGPNSAGAVQGHHAVPFCVCHPCMYRLFLLRAHTALSCIKGRRSFVRSAALGMTRNRPRGGAAIPQRIVSKALRRFSRPPSRQTSSLAPRASSQSRRRRPGMCSLSEPTTSSRR